MSRERAGDKFSYLLQKTGLVYSLYEMLGAISVSYSTLFWILEYLHYTYGLSIPNLKI